MSSQLTENELSKIILEAAIEVHRLGRPWFTGKYV
jgi:hypothetical protein